jgi:hypothetical protein
MDMKLNEKNVTVKKKHGEVNQDLIQEVQK